jgi:hypothetical protein
MTSRKDDRLVNALAVLGGVAFALLVVVMFIWLSGDGIDDAAPTTTGASTSSIPLFDGDIATKSNQDLEGDPGPNLTALRVGDHPEDGYVRVVFDLTGEGTPLYVVGYEAGPFQETSGDTVEVDGSAFLVVHISPARTHDIDTGDPTYIGDEELDPGTDPIVEIQFIDDFEASMTWVIGLTGERPFAVRVFQDPLRVVVDIAK